MFVFCYIWYCTSGSVRRFSILLPLAALFGFLLKRVPLLQLPARVHLVFELNFWLSLFDVDSYASQFVVEILLTVLKVTRADSRQFKIVSQSPCLTSPLPSVSCRRAASFAHKTLVGDDWSVLSCGITRQDCSRDKL